MKKRLFAAFVSLCIIMSMLPTMVFAEGVQDSGIVTSESGLCEHHTQHDESCGYTEGTAEIPCSHEHNENCGGLTDPEACNHTHDKACDFVPATEGTPCTFVCEVCNAQDSGNPATPSDAQPEECTCETLCTGEEINGDCPVCSAEGAELDKVCVGAAPMLPVTVLAAGEHDSHSNNWMEFTAGTTTLSGGSYYLSGDVEYSGTESITVSGEVILCLNDHKLDLKGRRISVGSGASFTLCDCSTGGGVYVDEGGTFTMAGGSINNNKATSGGGGGVMVNLGTFTLSGGSITGNATNDETYGSGGGVCLYGTFYLSGDSIIQNNTKAGSTDNLYLGWQTINITGPLGENAHIGVTAENVPRSFISGWSNNMVGENPADYFSSDGDACGIGLNANGDVVLGSLCTTITLNPNGGALPEYSLVAGAALPIPTKTGYTFAGWYENQEFSGDPVTDVPTDSTKNLNFYAKWTANTYTIIFDANGGSVNPTSAVTVAGKLTSLPTPTYDGYDFIGWYTQKDGGEKVTTDTVFAMDSTIYAHWSNIPVTSLELNKGTLTLQEKDSDTLTVTVKPADATNQDVTWESSNTSIATVSEDGTVTAISAGNATITATAADGSGISASCTLTVTHGKMVQTPKKDATCTVDGTEEYWMCEICGKHFEDESGTIPTTPEENKIQATGHSYGEPVWNWSEDGKTCTVTFTCEKDETHKETPKVIVTSAEKTPGTCTETGVTTYTATVEFNGQTYTDTKDLTDIPATGHSYDNGKCTVCGAIASDFKVIITAGANGSWQKGTKDGLTFTSNAANKHFQKVQVDGKDLDASNYTVKEGSTIVNLKTEYLETLSVGKHTLAIVSETGTATTEFTVKAAAVTDDTQSPQTGDDSNIALWIAVLLAAGTALTGTAVYSRKRKYSK